MTLLKFVLTQALGSQTEPPLMGEVEPIMQRRADCQQILGQYRLCVVCVCVCVIVCVCGWCPLGNVERSVVEAKNSGRF